MHASWVILSSRRICFLHREGTKDGRRFSEETNDQSNLHRPFESSSQATRSANPAQSTQTGSSDQQQKIRRRFRSADSDAFTSGPSISRPLFYFLRIQDSNKGVKRQRHYTMTFAPRFGFHLYRLRAHKHLPLAPYETDLPSWFEGAVEYCCLMDYLVDIEWLISVLPSLKTIPKVMIVHGARKDDRLRASLERHGLEHVDLHYPPCPIPFGKHHTKACVIKLQDSVRVIIHTANLTYSDCGEKTQGAWVRDFPLKDDASVRSEFETDFVDYLTALDLPSEQHQQLMTVVKAHDYSSAEVKLIPSIPGYHKGESMQKYGHLLMRHCLSKELFSSDFHASPLVCQISSLGALDQKWLLEEFMPSFSSGKVEDGETDLEAPSKDVDGLRLIWPTVEQVRLSYDGWASGRSTAGLSKNVKKSFLQPHWHKFEAGRLDRDRALPHIKTYTRYSKNRLAWVLLTSHNLSRAAWGAIQKQGEQFMIRSFELGVLFLPSLQKSLGGSTNSTDGEVPEDTAFVSYSSEGSDANAIQFCLPYDLPPKRYDKDDAPSVTDVRLPGVDADGRKWGSCPTRYGLLEPTENGIR